ncbi:hypothetical protein VTK73DRAFT_3025 [Phialemonium thermophilum]|uniref:Uncharacterized protein n=1 Tax=Phialemonium thermophilum TaxID=223376 RepID=A0ABR3VPB8_9PEZI
MTTRAWGGPQDLAVSAAYQPLFCSQGFHSTCVPRDEDIDPDAERYNAFRFCPTRYEGSVGGDDGAQEKARTTTPHALVTTSPTFLAFCHEPSACWEQRLVIDMCRNSGPY